jgi:hypothetical protein
MILNYCLGLLIFCVRCSDNFCLISFCELNSSIQVQAANKSGANSVFSLSFPLQGINRVVDLDKISKSVKLNSEVQKREYGRKYT